MIYIYTLLDPITYEVRYVGQTKNYKIRYTTHIRESKLNSSHKSNWIKKLYKDNKYLLMDIIDICNKEDYPYYEKYYISLYKLLGYNLLNMTDGGEGISGYKYTLNDRLKRSNRMKGIGNTFYGKKHSQEAISKISIKNHYANLGNKNPMYGKKQKDKSKKIMSLKKKGLYDGIKNPRAKKLYQYGWENNEKVSYMKYSVWINKYVIQKISK